MHLYSRVFQFAFRYGAYFMPWRSPQLLEGKGVYDEILAVLPKDMPTMIITDPTITKLGLTKQLLSHLDQNQYPYVYYDKAMPNPTISSIEDALSLYHKNGCHAVIAFGGGSPMDCAKVVLAKVAKPNQPIEKMKGLLRVRKKLRPLIAIPTTAGTGSETTVAAVVINDKTQEKYAISDHSLIPTHAALIPELTTTLPPSITSTTGLDALTHAVEAYIGGSNTKGSKADAIGAVQLVHKHLITAYKQGDNLEARKGMQMASFLGGKAFTRAYVGNVHAMAHALGGQYRVAHGLANAILLPVVLKAYGTTVYPKLAQLSDAIPLCTSNASQKDKAQAFLKWIDNLNAAMDIPTTIPQILEKDVDTLVERAYKEANPFYPVPVIFSRAQFKALYLKVGGVSHDHQRHCQKST